MKNLITRSVTGVVFVALMVAGILYNQYTFLLIITVVLAGSLNEFYNITAPKREVSKSKLGKKGFLMVVFLLSYWVSYLLVAPPVRAMPDPSHLFTAFFQVLLMQRDSALAMNAIIPSVMALLFMVELFNKNEKPFENIGWNLVAVCYLLIPMVLTNKIYAEKGGLFLVAIFGIIWLYDSACYAFGSVLGRTPLLQRISPKKTVEGLVGGALFTLIAAYFVPARIPGLEVLGPIEWTILTAIIIIGATFGDLVESLLKRSLDIKDSGSIMPGHGGFLDRFDAYFLAVPFIAFMLWAFAQVANLITLIEFISK